MPSILLNFILKTAGVYVWHGISEGLNLKEVIRSILPRRGNYVTTCGRIFKGRVLHDHLEASWKNKTIISAFLDKMILNVRNPRMKKQ
jgi:hypothetical protein